MRLKAYSSFSGVSLVGDYATGGGGSTQTYTNTTDFAIGDNTTIGAGSVVTRDIPSDVVAAGNPCRVIRRASRTDEAANAA